MARAPLSQYGGVYSEYLACCDWRLATADSKLNNSYSNKLNNKRT